MKQTSIIMLFILAFCFMSNAQEKHEAKNVIMLSYGYTHIPSGSDLEHMSENGFWVPTVGLDYGHLIGKKWEIGFMLDFEMDHYIIAQKDLERDNAFIAIVGAAYNPWKHLYFLTGLGIEMEKNKNLFILRLGTEYAFHLTEHWAIAPGFNFDWKEDYETYGLSIGIRYNF